MAILKIGVAGYMGAGKSSVAKLLVNRGFCLIDADQEAKKLYRDDTLVTQAVIETFGDSVTENDELSFSKLGRVAFKALENLKKLNDIVHPPLLKKLQYLIGSNQSKMIVLDAALIPLWKIDTWFDVNIWVEASIENRLHRIISRSPGLDMEMIRSRMNLQQQLFAAPAAPHWIWIDNNDSCDALLEKTASLLKGQFSGMNHRQT